MMRSITGQLQEAIRHGGMTRYKISLKTGVPQSQLCRFVKGGYGLGTAAMERVADALGLEIVLQRKGDGKGNDHGKPGD